MCRLKYSVMVQADIVILHNVDLLTFYIQAPERLLLWVLQLQTELTEIEVNLKQHDVLIDMLDGRNTVQKVKPTQSTK